MAALIKASNGDFLKLDSIVDSWKRGPGECELVVCVGWQGFHTNTCLIYT